jgi:hypothetical protein
MAKSTMMDGVDFKKPSQEDIQRGLELLEKERIRKEKIARGELKGYKKWNELNDEEKDKRRAYTKRRAAQQKVILRKAAEAGITASEREIDEEMNA